MGFEISAIRRIGMSKQVQNGVRNFRHPKNQALKSALNPAEYEKIINNVIVHVFGQTFLETACCRYSVVYTQHQN